MSQLFGISASEPVGLEFSFRERQHRGRGDADGIGFAYWGGDGAHIIKSARSLYDAESPAAEQIVAQRSKVFLCHVRFASRRGRAVKNTHPFRGQLRGRDYVFAHNGTLHGWEKLNNGRVSPGGGTDSESAFLWMLGNLHAVSAENFDAALGDCAAELRGMGSFNFLLSDGETLWACADDSLYYIERTPPFGGRLARLLDEGYTLSLADVKAPGERAALVASEPLSDESGWTRLKRGEMIKLRDGHVLKTHVQV